MRTKPGSDSRQNSNSIKSNKKIAKVKLASLSLFSITYSISRTNIGPDGIRNTHATGRPPKSIGVVIANNRKIGNKKNNVTMLIHKIA